MSFIYIHTLGQDTRTSRTTMSHTGRNFSSCPDVVVRKIQYVPLTICQNTLNTFISFAFPTNIQQGHQFILICMPAAPRLDYGDTDAWSTLNDDDDDGGYLRRYSYCEDVPLSGCWLQQRLLLPFDSQDQAPERQSPCFHNLSHPCCRFYLPKTKKYFNETNS